MANLRQQTIDTYNNSALELAAYYRGVGVRAEDIALAFQLVGEVKNPKVLEIGCGDGRDAKEILKYTDDYVGIDISKEMVKIAKRHVPNANLKVIDVLEYEFPKELDLVISFASLYHLKKEELKVVIDKVHDSLKPGGVFYLSLKHEPNYSNTIKEDIYGTRLFYFYNPEIIMELAEDRFEVVESKKGYRGVSLSEWFEMGLRKK